MSSNLDILTAEYIETSLKSIDDLKESNQQLQDKVAELQDNAITLEKVANQKEEELKLVKESSAILMEPFSKDKIEKVVAKLVKLAYIAPSYAEHVTNDIVKNPEIVLDLLGKISEASLSLPSSGTGISKESSFNQVDPDGWTKLRDTN